MKAPGVAVVLLGFGVGLGLGAGPALACDKACAPELGFGDRLGACVRGATC